MISNQELIEAVKNGDRSQAKQAIESGLDVAQIQIGEKPILRVACELGRREICELLVRGGADVNQVVGARRHSLLHSAVANSNYGFASILLSLRAVPDLRASNDATPLHIAARTQQGYMAEKLIEHNANINAQDKQGRTPLHWAVEKEDFNMIKLLIKHDCDVNLVDRRKRSPTTIALSLGATEIAEFLLKHGGKYSETSQQSRHRRVAENPNSQKSF